MIDTDRGWRTDTKLNISRWAFYSFLPGLSARRLFGDVGCRSPLAPDPQPTRKTDFTRHGLAVPVRSPRPSRPAARRLAKPPGGTPLHLAHVPSGREQARGPPGGTFSLTVAP